MPTAVQPAFSAKVSSPPPAFHPLAPQSLAEAGLTEHQTEGLVLKALYARGAATGRAVAEQIALPFGVVESVLFALKAQRFVVYKGAASLADYVYELTEVGTQRARQHAQDCTYCGAAPVPLSDYVASVEAQSVRKQTLRLCDVKAALADLVLGDELLGQLGEAICAGLGCFLFGAAGNGKTSIAQRVVKAYGEHIWIPRAILAGGTIIRLYDPIHHERVAEDSSMMTGPYGVDPAQAIDARWVKIRRPTIVVGGELTMEHLEVSFNKATGVVEAPLQLKSNGGALVIDDFGRQRVSPGDLLNRWVMPLERRVDHHCLPNGRKFEAPFDQLLVFSTNLDPAELVDEAFLRRIPYKLEINSPTIAQFRLVFLQQAEAMDLACGQQVLDDLIARHFVAAGRQPRFCHARDLLTQVETACKFRELPAVVTTERLDAAVKNYFAI